MTDQYKDLPCVLTEPQSRKISFMPNPADSIPPRMDDRHKRVETLAEIEKAAILAAIDRCGGSPAVAAEQLQISTATIYRKLKIYKSRQH